MPSSAATSGDEADHVMLPSVPVPDTRTNETVSQSSLSTGIDQNDDNSTDAVLHFDDSNGSATDGADESMPTLSIDDSIDVISVKLSGNAPVLMIGDSIGRNSSAINRNKDTRASVASDHSHQTGNHFGRLAGNDSLASLRQRQSSIVVSRKSKTVHKPSKKRSRRSSHAASQHADEDDVPTPTVQTIATTRSRRQRRRTFRAAEFVRLHDNEELIEADSAELKYRYAPRRKRSKADLSPSTTSLQPPLVNRAVSAPNVTVTVPPQGAFAKSTSRQPLSMSPLIASMPVMTPTTGGADD
ncbi:MAG: hypothetical protein MHM6MM_000449 [Cercozoa sp. M6MM]